MCDDARTLSALQELLKPMQSLVTQYNDLVRDVDDMRVSMNEASEELAKVAFMCQMLWLHPAHRLVRVGWNPQTFTAPPIPPLRKPMSAGVEIPAAE